jgi:hypothetical protein
MTELGFGIDATVFSRIRLFIIPDVFIHFREQVSTKVGLVYGISAGF